MSSSKELKFTKDFTLQQPICEEGIEKAIEVLRSGRIHRYNVTGDEKSEAVLLEEEFAKYIGKKYCLSCASCGSAMYLALKSIGITSGDKVLCNAFTLAPVPGAIENSGATIELVDIIDDCTIDLDDFKEKAKDAKCLMLSHMRGHITNMDSIVEICNENDVILIEDCAHTMGANWNGKKSGSFGSVGCFSTQTYKHINSGEGGLLVTDNPEIIAKAILYSGSYMLYERHTSRPENEVFEDFKKVIPNYSCRMDNLRAAILRPQISKLDEQCKKWNNLYLILEKGLVEIDGVTCPKRNEKESYVGSSIQFSLVGKSEASIKEFLSGCKELGVEIKWFGDKEPVGFTSSYANWEYIEKQQALSNTSRILSALFDMRIPLTFDENDCKDIIRIIKSVLANI